MRNPNVVVGVVLCTLPMAVLLIAALASTIQDLDRADKELSAVIMVLADEITKLKQGKP